MKLNWKKCKGDEWCPFFTVDLQHAAFTAAKGVYVIWHGGSNPKTVYVGKGNIGARISDHRGKSNIAKYSELGLFVTWAKVDSSDVDGVESYLVRALKPLENQVQPSASPVTVNHPWA